MDFLLNITAWQWMSLGVALLSFELMFPGVFMLWFGLSALITSGLVYLLNLPNTFAIVIFLIAGLVLSYLFYKKQHSPALVNDASNKMVGKVIVLDEPIVNGRGRAKIGDSHWTVTGQDLPIGTKVTIVEVQGNTLSVKIF
jgi:membrane protein implicated in regulation of membrane protease activity